MPCGKQIAAHKSLRTQGELTLLHNNVVHVLQSLYRFKVPLRSREWMPLFTLLFQYFKILQTKKKSILQIDRYLLCGIRKTTITILIRLRSWLSAIAAIQWNPRISLQFCQKESSQQLVPGGSCTDLKKDNRRSKWYVSHNIEDIPSWSTLNMYLMWRSNTYQQYFGKYSTRD